MNQSTKQCIFGSHIFHISSESFLCVCVHACSHAHMVSLSPYFVSLLRACLVTGSTSLLSATFVLEVRISGVPRSKGRLAGREGVEEGEQGREVGS